MVVRLLMFDCIPGIIYLLYRYKHSAEDWQ